MSTINKIKINNTEYDLPGGSNNAVLWSEREGYVGKNLLINELETKTAGQVTFTVNSDKSISTSGTSNTDWVTVNINPSLFLKAGRYIISGITGGSVETYRITVTGDDITDFTLYDGSSTFDVSSDSNVAITLSVRYSGVNMNGKVFYPMIRLATIEDDTYEPYLPTNTELKDLYTALREGTLTKKADLSSTDNINTTLFETGIYPFSTSPTGVPDSLTWAILLHFKGVGDNEQQFIFKGGLGTIYMRSLSVKTPRTWGEWFKISTSGGSGDMLKSVYDTDNDGIVDKAEKVMFGDTPIEFAIDGQGRYGYKKAGADTVTPFRNPTGNATTDDVVSGKTFANATGDSLTGTFTGITVHAQSEDEEIEITPSEGSYIDKVIVDPISLQSKTVQPARVGTTIRPDSGYAGLSSVVLNTIDTSQSVTKTLVPTSESSISLTKANTAVAYALLLKNPAGASGPYVNSVIVRIRSDNTAIVAAAYSVTNDGTISDITSYISANNSGSYLILTSSDTTMAKFYKKTSGATYTSVRIGIYTG